MSRPEPGRRGPARPPGPRGGPRAEALCPAGGPAPMPTRRRRAQPSRRGRSPLELHAGRRNPHGGRRAEAVLHKAREVLYSHIPTPLHKSIYATARQLLPGPGIRVDRHGGGLRRAYRPWPGRRLWDPERRQRGPPARPRRGGRGGASPRRARRAYALGDVYTSGAAIYTSRRGGARLGARPEEGARRAAAKAQSGTGRNAHPNQAPIRHDADTTADTRPLKTR